MQRWILQKNPPRRSSRSNLWCRKDTRADDWNCICYVKNGQDHILITRLSSEAADMISQVHPLHYHKDSRVGIIGEMPKPTGKGKIVVATGGTSDIPVAEEAALTAEIHANEVVRLYVLNAV